MNLGTILAIGHGILAAAAPPMVPKTPPGLAGCTHALMPQADLNRRVGETIRYWVEVNGMSVGTVDFKIYKNGVLEQVMATEYRSQFKLDALVAAFIPVDGKAAALVPQGARLPLRAMDQFHNDTLAVEENFIFDATGTAPVINVKRNDKANEERPRYATAVVDFVTGFYWARSLPKDMNGCVLVCGNQRVYTMWIKPGGEEKVPTPVGEKLADRYDIRYGSDKGRQTFNAAVWLATDSTRLPYRAEIFGSNHVIAQIHLYETGGHEK